MFKFYAYLAGTVLAATSLASCSSSHYAFRPNTPAYHEVASQVQVQPAPAATPSATPAEQPAATPAAPVSAAAQKPAVTPGRKAVAPARRLVLPGKVGLLQRAALAKVTKQLHRQPEIAKAGQAQSKAGTAGIVIGIGLVILLIGGLIGGTNFVATIGGVTFLVGLIMLIIALISGK
ncbi:hypothetical protein [Hymenobacter pini]|uniref:hypothetical protein n=1 Tax=Hymenobacter pini TaxID=2880879 RepID=UPI001CF43C73|nr:hypothetical protein [Hymenobacter pini]MCA8831471.1 hypothetical protein [Hymenobacter pini]